MNWSFNDIDELILLINYLPSYAPLYSHTSTVIIPMNAIFEWPMCMPGHAIFRAPSGEQTGYWRPLR